MTNEERVEDILSSLRGLRLKPSEQAACLAKRGLIAPDPPPWPRMAPVSVQIEARGPRNAWTVLRWLVDVQGWPEDALWAAVWPTVVAEAEPRIARTKNYPARQPHEPAVRDTVRVEGATFRARVIKSNGLASCWSRSVSR